MSQAFLDDYHARFAVPATTVITYVRSAVEVDVAEFERVVGGYDNEVYRVRLADHRTVYLRIQRAGHHSFDHEVTAMELARGAGLPVPEVIMSSTISDGADRRSAMIIDASAGRSLAAVLPTLSRTGRSEVLNDLGRILRTLHSVAMPGVWRPEDDGRWPDPAGLRRGFIADRRAEHDQLVAAGLSPSEVGRTLSLIGKSPDTPPISDFVLCHGDVTPNHVFVDSDLSIVGLIDWGMWHGGSPIGELAYLSSWADNDRDRAALLTGYGIDASQASDATGRMAMSLVNQLVGHVAHHVGIADPDGTANVVRALRRALSELNEDDH